MPVMWNFSAQRAQGRHSLLKKSVWTGHTLVSSSDQHCFALGITHPRCWQLPKGAHRKSKNLEGEEE